MKHPTQDAMTEALVIEPLKEDARAFASGCVITPNPTDCNRATAQVALWFLPGAGSAVKLGTRPLTRYAIREAEEAARRSAVAAAGEQLAKAASEAAKAQKAVPKPVAWSGRDPSYRINLTKAIGKPPSGKHHAHHVFPVEYGDNFAQLSIDANAPRYGAWVRAPEHQGFSSEYSKDWGAFLRGSPTQDEVLEFGRMMGGKYGFDVNY